MNDDLRAAAAAYVLSLADDEMILSHRDSEWTGHAPILEEDIAFANIALDEMGHALLWYQAHAALVEEDAESYPDRLVFQRAPSAYHHTPLVELPNGDWAHSMLRQFLFDAAELAWLAGLTNSTHAPIAAVARKIINEERYHDRHTRAWVRRLGLGTDESRSRMQRALNDLWPFLPDLTAARPGETELAAAGVCPPWGVVREGWQADVFPNLEQAGMRLPAGFESSGFDRTRHTTHLEALVAQMQSVARLEPEGAW